MARLTALSRIPWLVGSVLFLSPGDAAAQVDVAKVDAVMRPYTGTDRPGCALAVVQDGGVALAKGYGMADLERGVPITPSTVFDIGSTSKQFTAASILLLAQEGKLGLDDDIKKYLPGLRTPGAPPVTVRHLLHHTGGLRDYLGLLALAGTSLLDHVTAAETLALLERQQGVDFPAGARWDYSNTGYFLLAQIVERVSGEPMATFVPARLFRPLGMSRSSIFDDHTRLVPGRALAYEQDGKGWKLDLSRWEQTGDGSVLTTVLDLATWDRNFYQPRVGGPELVEALQRKGTLADGTELDYAAGLFHGTYRGQPVVSHSGSWAGYRALFTRFPTRGTSVILLCNAGSATPRTLVDRIADVVLDGVLDAAPAANATGATTVSEADLAAWPGRYRDGETGQVLEILREGDGLVAVAGQRFALTPAGPARFTAMGATATFTGERPSRQFTLSGPGAPPRTYRELVPYQPAPAELTALAGRYRSEELMTDWVLAVEGGALLVRAPGIQETAKLIARDEVEVPGLLGAVLDLTRKKGRVAGFTVRAPVKGIRFVRAP